MTLHLYDISEHSLVGNYILYNPITHCCSSFNEPTHFIVSYERVIAKEFSYFTPNEGTLIYIFDDEVEDAVNFWEQHPELLV